MKSDDMILKAAIVHIVDSSVGVPVLSDHLIDTGTDFSDLIFFLGEDKAAVREVYDKSFGKALALAGQQGLLEDNFPICSNRISKRSPKATT